MWECSQCGSPNSDAAEVCEFCGMGIRAAAALAADEWQLSAGHEGPSGGASGLPPEVPAVSWQDEPIHPADPVAAAPRQGDSRPASAPSLSAEPRAAAPEPRMEPAVPQDQSTLVLEELRTRSRIVIDTDGFVGREGDFGQDVLGDRIHLSRQHAEFRRTRGGGWTITHQSAVNPTLVFPCGGGRVSLALGVETPIHDGETIRMADVTFRVHIERPEADSHADGRAAAGGQQFGNNALSGAGDLSRLDEPAAAPDGAAEPSPQAREVEGWFVDCLCCGASYLVADRDVRIDACPHCTDALDRRLIARAVPAWGTRREGEFEDAR